MLSKPRRPSNCDYEVQSGAPQVTGTLSTSTRSTTSASHSIVRYQAIGVDPTLITNRDISCKNKFTSLCKEAKYQLSQYNYYGVFKCYKQILELQGISEENRWNILDQWKAVCRMHIYYPESLLVERMRCCTRQLSLRCNNHLKPEIEKEINWILAESLSRVRETLDRYVRTTGRILVNSLIQACKNALEIWEQSPELKAWLYLVMYRAYRSKRNETKALESFKQISRLDLPIDIRIQASSIYSSIERVFFNEGNMAESIEEIRKVLARSTTSEGFKWQVDDFIGPDLCEAWQSKSIHNLLS